MRDILEDHWPISSLMSWLKRTKRLRDTESWSNVTTSLILAEGWENYEFMSFLNHGKAEFSEQTTTQYPQRGGHLQGQRRSKHWFAWGRPNHTRARRAGQCAEAACALMEVWSIRACVTGRAWTLFGTFLTPQPQVHTREIRGRIKKMPFVEQMWGTKQQRLKKGTDQTLLLCLRSLRNEILS